MTSHPVETFAADWLALRARHDRAARSKPLARAFLASLPCNACVADLACGLGANARYLASLDRPDLHWTLVDADAVLLRAAGAALPGSVRQCLDLARPRRALGLGRFRGITASALCDLVSGAWLDALIREAAGHGLPMLFALTVDGRIALTPADADDGAILRGFRRDQRRDKGFGPALGPGAPMRLAASLRAHGHRLRTAQSDWRLGAADGPTLDALLSGIAAAARNGGSMEPGKVDAWLRRRREAAAARRLSVVVGHIDIIAAPRSRRVNLT